MHLLLSVTMGFRHTLKPIVHRIIVIMIVSAAVISLFYLPIRFGDFRLDMRMIPLIFLAYMHGWKFAVPTLILVSLWRFILGGPGMLPGIFFGMLGPTLVALAVRQKINFKWRHLIKIAIVLICWLISDFPIIWLMPNGIEIFQNIAFVRASSLVATSIILYTFIRHEQQRADLNNELKKLANEDSLTRLLNRRKFFEVLEQKINNKKEQNNHYIAMIDIDFFKQLNDTYGHVIGDEILKELGKTLKSFEEDQVKVGRYGGEEFIMYIGGKSASDVLQLVKMIHHHVQNTPFHSGHLTIQITLSIGLAKFDPNESLLYAINRADKNLYEAKDKGRNCIVTSFAPDSK